MMNFLLGNIFCLIEYDVIEKKVADFDCPLRSRRHRMYAAKEKSKSKTGEVRMLALKKKNSFRAANAKKLIKMIKDYKICF